MRNELKTAAKVSIVIPVLNEEGNISTITDAIDRILSENRIDFELILVDDGSSDRTWEFIIKESKKNDKIKGLSLSRNFGHQNALFAGINHSTGQCIITMDGDLQHPPQLIPKMVEEWINGNQIVETKRLDSSDSSFFKKFSSKYFYKIFSQLSGIAISEGSSDFRLIDRSVANVIMNMEDVELFLRGMTQWVGFKKMMIPYQASARFSGTTKYSLLKMMKFSLAALLSFSIIPLKLGVWIGFIAALLSLGELVYIFIRYFQGGTVSGWASTLTIVSFMFSILFILIGIIGVYLGSIFEMLKNRPRYIIMDTAGTLGTANNAK